MANPAPLTHSNFDFKQRRLSSLSDCPPLGGHEPAALLQGWGRRGQTKPGGADTPHFSGPRARLYRAWGKNGDVLGVEDPAAASSEAEGYPGLEGERIRH